MEFKGNWTVHPKFGRQFKAQEIIEKKPASAAALEKYLGSGLIKGVGPKTAKKIVKYFKKETLEIFDNQISRLQEVEGIAKKKLQQISSAWKEHKDISEIMMFLQSHGISTLFAVKIFKLYNENAIKLVCENPYRLADDFYGVGFFSADKIALSIGFSTDSPLRISSAIKYTLSASKNEGHCYLDLNQIVIGVNELLKLNVNQKTEELLLELEKSRGLITRELYDENINPIKCFYSKALYYDEDYCGKNIKSRLKQTIEYDSSRIDSWLDKYCSKNSTTLSDEQKNAVSQIVRHPFSVLTGGPGCGKTTTTKVLVALFMAMKMNVTLAAPTGRAAQRMGEVIGLPAKTIHRLLAWTPNFDGQGNFKFDKDNPIDTDVIIIDECSMLDISLSASLLKAIPENAQIVFIGDADQLPSVGAGNVLKDLIESGAVPCQRLTKIFRQAGESSIIKYAHEINKGGIPKIPSPLKRPSLWHSDTDCLFIDSDEVTQEQLKFICKVKKHISKDENDDESKEYQLNIPDKFSHVDIEKLTKSEDGIAELKEVLKTVHPYSSINYGLTATQMIQKLYMDTIPKYIGKDKEVQILSPMIRGSLGTNNLNRIIQQTINPPNPDKSQINVGEKIFREGDRVIQRRNNYDLGVFNGDIGKITLIDAIDLKCQIEYSDQNEKRVVNYEKAALSEIELAYAITIHKSQGSEFDVAIIPIMSQHFKMLFRNLIYTGLTRAKKMAVFVGTRRALAMAVKTNDSRTRQTALQEIL